MVIVDTHVHTSLYWFEPIEIILCQMNRNRVDKATLVQFLGQTDNRYIIESAHRFPGRFYPVVSVDTDRTDAPDTLKQLAKEGARSVRLRVTTRSPGNDPLAIWRTCAELSLPVSCGGNEEDFASDEFLKLIKSLPHVAVIIEHLGHGQHGQHKDRSQQDELPPYTTYRKLLALADCPNTYIKVGGLGEICKRPFPFRQPFYSVGGVPPFIQMAYEAFGPSRMMWGSDYPLCSYREGYSNTLHYLREYLTSFCSEGDKEWIFGKTALSLFDS
ncbi:amidohydrolase family protein [Chloroflexota bacterium]